MQFICGFYAGNMLNLNTRMVNMETVWAGTVWTVILLWRMEKTGNIKIPDNLRINSHNKISIKSYHSSYCLLTIYIISIYHERKNIIYLLFLKCG